MAQSLNVISGWAKDDLIASQTYAYDPAFLASKLPAVGTFTDTRRYEDGGTLGAIYTLTTNLTRVA